MSIYNSCRKKCPDFIVNDFVTKIIKDTDIRPGYGTIRVTPKNGKITEKALVYCEVTPITVVCRKGCLVDIVDIIVKSRPINTELSEIIPIKQLFEREIFFYESILVELSEIQENLNVTPTLIAANKNENEESIILQNTGAIYGLKYEKWVGELTQEHIKVVLTEFAKLHAVFYVFAKKQPNKLEEFKMKLKGGYLSTLQNHKTEKIIEKILKNALYIYTKGEPVTEKLIKFVDEMEIYFENVLNQSSTADVIVHGDPTNNFLFRHEKREDGTSSPSSAKLLDWHLVKLGSPILDLSQFLFANCSYDDLNNNNIQEFLKYYHAELRKHLNGFDYNVDDVFSFVILEEHWKKYAKFGFALAFLALKIITLEVNKRPNANDKNLTDEEFVQGFTGPSNDEFIRRIKDLVKFGVNTKLL